MDVDQSVATVTKILSVIFLGLSILIGSVWHVEARLDESDMQARAHAESLVIRHEGRPHLKSISRDEYREDMTRLYSSLKDINNKLLKIGMRLNSRR
jgi:PHD/YefM family antitoxin component YafN of YafNO toxin-antitoxin module